MAKNSQSNSGKHWKQSEISQLKFMAKNDFSTKSIAKNLERSTNAVYEKASEIGQSLKPKDK